MNLKHNWISRLTSSPYSARPIPFFGRWALLLSSADQWMEDTQSLKVWNETRRAGGGARETERIRCGVWGEKNRKSERISVSTLTMKNRVRTNDSISILSIMSMRHKWCHISCSDMLVERNKNGRFISSTKWHKSTNETTCCTLLNGFGWISLDWTLTFVSLEFIAYTRNPF